MFEIEFPDLKDWTEGKTRKNLSNEDFYYERKFDGTACMVDVFSDGEPILWGRGILKDGCRQDYTRNFSELLDAFRDLGVRARILGEIVSFDPDTGADVFKRIQSRATRKKNIEEYQKLYPAKFLAFDIIILNDTDLRSLNYKRRRIHLNNLLTPQYLEEFDSLLGIVPTVHQELFKSDLFNDMVHNGWEGLVIKHGDAPFGQKMYKYKPVVTEDVIWYGEYKEGTGKNLGKVGSMICYQYLNGELTEVAKVGGLTDAKRNEMTELSHSGKVSRTNPMVLEVKAMEYLVSGKLRSPRFVRERNDKGPEQCKRTMK